MNDNTVSTEGHEALLTEEGQSKVETAKVYAVMGLAAVGAYVVGKKVYKMVKSAIDTRNAVKSH